MKKNTVRLISGIMLSVMMMLTLLTVSASALTGSFNNYNSPKQVVLPTVGCGGNKIGLYYAGSYNNNDASSSSKYKWQMLVGEPSVIDACHALQIDIKNIIILTDIYDHDTRKTKSAIFHGSDMTTSTYYNVSSITASSDDAVDTYYYYYEIKVRSPYDGSIIKFEYESHTID